MNAEQKLAILRAVECSPLSVTTALARLDVPTSTYYPWREKFRSQGRRGLQDASPHKGRVWNQLLPDEREERSLLLDERDEPLRVEDESRSPRSEPLERP